jgi:hypothetical protein
MQHSVDDNRNSTGSGDEPGQSLAILAEAVYLANLLILPGIAFIALAWIVLRYSAGAPSLARCHIRQTFSASIWAGVLLLVANLIIIAFGGYDTPATWVVVILYFTTVHATLVLLGTIGIARAMSGKHFHFPLVGRSCAGGAV